MKDRNQHAYRVYSDLAARFGASYRGVGYDLVAHVGRRNLVAHLAGDLVSHLPSEPRPLRILDLGCGNGLAGSELVGFLSKLGIESRIDGVDFVPANVEMAKDYFGYQRTVVADVTDRAALMEAFGGQSYGLVFQCEVFQYIHPQDYEGFLGEVGALLRPDGFVLLVFPNMRGIYKRTYKRVFNRRFRRQFHYDFDRVLVEGLLTSHGLTLLSRWGTLLAPPVAVPLKPTPSLRELAVSQLGVLARCDATAGGE